MSEIYKGIIIRCEPVTANATPMRHFDFCAWVDGNEEAGQYGYGSTETEALDALGEILVEHVDDHIHDLKTSGAISEEIAEECFTAIDSLAYLPY